MKQLIFTDNDQGGVILVANIKGGVGKSTIATNLASSFASRGPTLLIDLDVQGSATSALGKNPTAFKRTSALLLKQRFYPKETLAPSKLNATVFGRARNAFNSFLLGRNSDITKVAVNVVPGLDLIPANTNLFFKLKHKHIKNLVFSLEVCREYYKYVVIDTASIWDDMIKALFIAADINLVPVTLNALATKSLKTYASEIGKLIKKNPHINVRIVKNEVYGTRSTTNTGKIRTMNENRTFLHSLFESFSKAPENGVFTLPRSIVLNLEIPESSVIRHAQDSGISLIQLKASGQLKKAFGQLTDSIQFILNRVAAEKMEKRPWYHAFIRDRLKTFAKAAIFLFIVLRSISLLDGETPPVSTPSMLEKTYIAPIVHNFKDNESLYQIAKYAISEYRAMVPSVSDIDRYVNEMVTIHNLTAHQTRQPMIRNNGYIERGTSLTFYPPAFIHNKNYEVDREIFAYYKTLVDDEHPYITGLWCERGLGGGEPHTGVDIACRLGSRIVSPIDGIARTETNGRGGNMVVIHKDDFVLLFAHMDQRFVKTGDKVKKGQVIGSVGLTGATSGPHVHFGYGIRSPKDPQRFEYIDPNNFIFRQNFYSDKLSAAGF